MSRTTRLNFRRSLVSGVSSSKSGILSRTVAGNRTYGRPDGTFLTPFSVLSVYDAGTILLLISAQDNSRKVSYSDLESETDSEVGD